MIKTSKEYWELNHQLKFGTPDQTRQFNEECLDKDNFWHKLLKFAFFQQMIFCKERDTDQEYKQLFAGCPHSVIAGVGNS